MPNGSEIVLRRLGLLIVISIILVFGGACSSPQPAAVSDRAQPPSRKIESHRVARGETLYSIAWRYGIDYRLLAHHNDISPPYTIYQDQRLRLDIARVESRVESTPRVEVRPPRAAAGADREPRPRPNSESTPVVNRAEKRTDSSPPASPPPLLAGPPQWRWPAQGRIIGAFGASTGLNKGIDIAGELGEPVIAAASGQVVYSGSGLRGYGNLLIIKHNDTYLSAYAHNDRLLLSEGDAVKAGDKIAEMGSSGTDKVKLHFEIRRDGKPVDPIRYLPKR